jgi:hypothetical protein
MNATKIILSSIAFIAAIIGGGNGIAVIQNCASGGEVICGMVLLLVSGVEIWAGIGCLKTPTEKENTQNAAKSAFGRNTL